jgi:hypothetical protein
MAANNAISGDPTAASALFKSIEVVELLQITGGPGRTAWCITTQARNSAF